MNVSKRSDDSEENTVLKETLAGGPHGVGDPNDQSLRRVELECLIPQLMRKITKEEKCATECQSFGECAKREGVSMVIKCREENNRMKSCMERWYSDPDFKEECKQKYLAERTRYRETGIMKVRPPRGHTQDVISSKEEKD